MRSVQNLKSDLFLQNVRYFNILFNNIFASGMYYAEKYSKSRGFLYKRYKKQETIAKDILYSRNVSWESHRDRYSYKGTARSYYASLAVERSIHMPIEAIELVDLCLTQSVLSALSPFALANTQDTLQYER